MPAETLGVDVGIEVGVKVVGCEVDVDVLKETVDGFGTLWDRTACEKASNRISNRFGTEYRWVCATPEEKDREYEHQRL